MKIIIICIFVVFLLSSAKTIGAEEFNSKTNRETVKNKKRDYWWQKLQWSESLCPRKAPGDDPEVNVYEIADGRKLVKIICFLGAYQGQQIYYLSIPNGGFTLLEFDQFESPDKGILDPYRSPEVIGTSQVLTASNQFIVFRKYRGIGDCGQLLTYSLEKTQPQLVEFRTRACDDDAVYIPPEEWQQIPINSLPKLETAK